MREDDIRAHRAEMRHRQALKDAGQLALGAWLINRSLVERALRKEGEQEKLMQSVSTRLFGELQLSLATGMTDGLVQAAAGIYFSEPTQDKLLEMKLEDQHLLAALMLAGEVINADLQADRGTVENLADFLKGELMRILAARGAPARVMSRVESLQYPSETDPLESVREHHAHLMAKVGNGLNRMDEVQAALAKLMEESREDLAPAAIAQRASEGAPFQLKAP
jgi:hypothetical protein